MEDKREAAGPSAAAGAADGAPRGGRTIQEVIDAVSGATWNTRNRIMEDLFKEDLAASRGSMPSFAPPGTPVERGE